MLIRNQTKDAIYNLERALYLCIVPVSYYREEDPECSINIKFTEGKKSIPIGTYPSHEYCKAILEIIYSNATYDMFQMPEVIEDGST